MDLIVTHDNADFDALSSLVAASKLYPHSRLLLPGSQERSVRNFLALIKDKIQIENERTCVFDDVDRLIVVDSRHGSRIGKAARLLEKDTVEVHLYDHHPSGDTDIRPDKELCEKVGATVTVILSQLERQGLITELSPLEATLMLLGIYQETGSLSYEATTRSDIDMVGKLLEQGAKLNAVSAYLNRELSESELGVFIEMLETVKLEKVGDVEVAFFECEDTSFHGEAASVVHKLRDVENYPLTFALFFSPKRTKIIARSRVGSVNVNEVLKEFGGGGHEKAASARAEGLSADEVRKRILRTLRRLIRPAVKARDLMTSPVRVLDEDITVQKALEKLERWGHKGAPVIGPRGQLKAMITKGDLEKALLQEMGHSRIKGYMARPLITASPGTSLGQLQEIITAKNKGRIPVVEDGKLLGMVTRTDILQKVHSGLFPSMEGELTSEVLADKMRKRLPGSLYRLIVQLGREADKRSVGAFIVGGFVRDLFLGRKNYDLDIVVEKDAVGFARDIADIVKGALVVHHKFGTATVVNPWPSWLGTPPRPNSKFKIDIATTRKETYDEPAQLPKVEFSSLREDLYRRDFTINAMAVKINSEQFGLFIDFFGGTQDLSEGIIRVLHDGSFIDDPTRVFRAVRFEKRFSFRIEDHTEYLIKHALKKEMFGRTENQRIRDELILMLSEETALEAVLRMKELNELRFIHPELTLSPNIKKHFRRMRGVIAWYRSNASGRRELDEWLVNFILVTMELSADQALEVAEKFVFTTSAAKRFLRFKECSSEVLGMLSQPQALSPSRIWEALTALSHESMLCMLAVSDSERATRRIKEFLSSYNTVKLKIKGEDIKKEGIPPGPLYRKVLKQVLYAKLDGKVSGREEELRLMRDLIGKI